MKQGDLVILHKNQTKGLLVRCRKYSSPSYEGNYQSENHDDRCIVVLSNGERVQVFEYDFMVISKK